MSSPLIPSGQQNFCDVWKDGVAGVVADLGVPSPTVAMGPLTAATSLAPEERDAKIAARFKCAGSLTGEFLWQVDKPVALRLAQLLMSEPAGAGAEFTGAHADAFAEFIRQAAGQAASIWKQRIGLEVEFAFLPPPLPPEAVWSQSAALQLSGEGLIGISATLLLAPQLVESLEAFKAATAAAPAPSAAPQPTRDANGLEGLPNNLDLLLDVELEATIRFGERELLLREIFALMPGSLVELNQLVNEPAELLIAGRTIARGEVVVVDGNFGLRVSEVASRGQRAAVLQN